MPLLRGCERHAPRCSTGGGCGDVRFTSALRLTTPPASISRTSPVGTVRRFDQAQRPTARSMPRHQRTVGDLYMPLRLTGATVHRVLFPLDFFVLAQHVLTSTKVKANADLCFLNI